MTHRRDIAGALIATFLAIAMGTASGLHFAAHNYGRGVAFLVTCLALIVVAAYSGARAMPHPFQPEIDELKDMLDAMDPEKKIEVLKAEFVRGDIGIHELEARTTVIHATGTDPGADQLLTPGEIRREPGDACPVCGEETGATHCAGTLWWPHATTVTVPRDDVPDLKGIQWDHALKRAGLRMPTEPAEPDNSAEREMWICDWTPKPHPFCGGPNRRAAVLTRREREAIEHEAEIDRQRRALIQDWDAINRQHGQGGKR